MRFFAPPEKGETDRMLKCARAALDAGRRIKRAARAEERPLRAAERPIAALTAAAICVFEELLTLARLNRGRVYPSYDYLASATALGRATVARALAQLEAAGFLVRQRRFRRIAGAGPGPRYKQTSNAYRALLPASVQRFLPRWMRPAPLPCDAQHDIAEDARAVARMRAGLSCRELGETVAGGALGKALAKLGAAIDRRSCESQNETEPLLQSYGYGKE
ncbi:helix-turn-helix domain-containing protein [Sphingosinithalassobacter sp. CS137]|uniref:helix-turn-helix domain-containing protein n=1 Tax=Sphingosinithalassobacter sp. CS137 TaxID=2762748 RepID=UPI0021CFF6EB|nr:helix-turn-helix domain-containing protein [Sphingosinithalassobacter sp. CS137]